MNCPKCGNKIDEENQKFCTKCGVEITNVKITQDIENIHDIHVKTLQDFIKSKSVIISAIVLLVFLLIGISTFAITGTNKKTVTTYKSIVPFEQSQIQNLSTREALDLLVQQDKDLSEYVNKHPNKNIDKLFENFYRNLLTFTGRETQLESKLWYDYNNPNDNSLNLVKNTKIIVMLETLAGKCAGINYDYLSEQYAEYLSLQWQEFLNLKRQEFNDRNGYTYYTDGSNVITPKNKRVKWLIDERKFLNKYPHFVMYNSMLEDFSIYVDDFISDKYLTFEIIGDNNKVIFKLREDAKEAYEEFLSKADKNTSEYKKIKKWYEILKKDNFEQGINFYKYEYELTGDEYYKKEYQRLEQQEKLKQLENKETWEKVAEHIYLNPNSLKTQDGYREGQFKVYKQPETSEIASFDLFEGSVYTITDVRLFQDGILYFTKWEYFDENNKYINGDYPSAYADMHYSEYKAGEIFYKGLLNK